MKMIKIINRDGNIELLSDEVDLKIDSNRFIYVKPKGKGYNMKKYLNTNCQVPYGLIMKEKHTYLIHLRAETLKKMGYETDQKQNGEDD